MIAKKIGQKIAQWAGMALLGYEIGDAINGHEVKVIERYNGVTAEKVQYESEKLSTLDIVILVLVLAIAIISIGLYVFRLCEKYRPAQNQQSNYRRQFNRANRRNARNNDNSSELDV